MAFIKKIEDFTCENCGEAVEGNGYTNHCPTCLWSKHVDVEPGDRGERCQGLMEPAQADFSRGEWHIIHKCKQCGFERRAYIREGDNIEEVMRVAESKNPSSLR